jgi:hypothetical protein
MLVIDIVVPPVRNVKNLLDAKCQRFPLFLAPGHWSRAGHCRLYGFPKLVHGVLERGVLPEGIDIRISLNINGVSAAIGNRSARINRGTSPCQLVQRMFVHDYPQAWTLYVRQARIRRSVVQNIGNKASLLHVLRMYSSRAGSTGVLLSDSASAAPIELCAELPPAT